MKKILVLGVFFAGKSKNNIIVNNNGKIPYISHHLNSYTSNDSTEMIISGNLLPSKKISATRKRNFFFSNTNGIKTYRPEAKHQKTGLWAMEKKSY